MRAINKGLEPRSLTQHKAQPHSGFDNYRSKEELRESLVQEQQGLCCYCMGRIRGEPDHMKIEHWQCQTRFPLLQLAYSNLIGACLGGEGQPPSHQHCDTKKGDHGLKWNPANAAHAIESRIRYLSDGRIESPDQEFDHQLNSVLNLNHAYLRNNRKAVLEAVLGWWRSTRPEQRNLNAQIQKRTGGQLELESYSPVALWFLLQKKDQTAK